MVVCVSVCTVRRVGLCTCMRHDYRPLFYYLITYMCKHVSHTKTKNSVNDKTAAGTHSHLHINENTHAYQDVQSASLLLVI